MFNHRGAGGYTEAHGGGQSNVEMYGSGARIVFITRWLSADVFQITSSPSPPARQYRNSSLFLRGSCT